MSEPTPLSAEIQILLAAHRPGLVTNCDCEPGQLRWAEHILARAIDAQATEIAALKGALENLMDEQNGPPLIRDGEGAGRVAGRASAEEKAA